MRLTAQALGETLHELEAQARKREDSLLIGLVCLLRDLTLEAASEERAEDNAGLTEPGPEPGTVPAYETYEEELIPVDVLEPVPEPEDMVIADTPGEPVG